MTNIPLLTPSGDAALDDGERPRRGIVVSLRRVHGGALRLTLDDVFSSSGDQGRIWRVDDFYTHFSTTLEAVQEMSVSDELLNNIGIALIARLSVDFEDAEPIQSGDA